MGEGLAENEDIETVKQCDNSHYSDRRSSCE